MENLLTNLFSSTTLLPYVEPARLAISQASGSIIKTHHDEASFAQPPPFAVRKLR